MFIHLSISIFGLLKSAMKRHRTFIDVSGDMCSLWHRAACESVCGFVNINFLDMTIFKITIGYKGTFGNFQVAQVCTNCGVNMGEYFCEVCKFYDDDVMQHDHIEPSKYWQKQNNYCYLASLEFLITSPFSFICSQMMVWNLDMIFGSPIMFSSVLSTIALIADYERAVSLWWLWDL